MLAAFPSPAAFQAATEADFAALLTGRHYPKAAQKAQQLWEQAQAPQLHADAPVAAAKGRYLLALVAQLRLVMEQVAEYDQAIARLCATHGDHDLFASLPGVGQRTAPRLLAEWGEDRGRYASAASVQALAGTSPGVFQSGAYRSTRIRNACSKPLRNVLYQVARESMQRDAWAHAYYYRKREEGKTFTMAVRALANHWVHILYAVWSNRETYDPAVLARAQHAHGRQSAYCAALALALPPLDRSPAALVPRAAPEAARPAPLGAGPAEQAARRGSRLAGRRLP